MREWLYEDGIGEARAALVEDGAIVAARIEREGPRARAGAVVAARLGEALADTGRARVTLEGGEPALLRPAPPHMPEGAALRVTVVREAIPEEDNPKPALVALAGPDASLAPGPTLRERIATTGVPVRHLSAHQPDALEAAGWSETLEAARTGLIAFPGGLLRLSLTPAMALFDVDGSLAPAPLACAGAEASARAIRLLDLAGSIGIDLPTLPDKAARAAAAAMIDRFLPQPFERTAVNGFGFLQIVRRRTRAALPELLRADPPRAAALALLRSAERGAGAGIRTIVAAPAVIMLLEARADWLEALARRIGAPVALRAVPGTPIWAGHVQPETPAR